MKKLVLISILLILSFNSLLSNEENKLELFVNHSNFYDFQLNIGGSLLGAQGFYKKDSFDFLRCSYGLRYNNDKIYHNIKMLIIECQGIFPTTIISNGEKENDTLRKEYVFSGFGMKFFDCNMFDYLIGDVSWIRINADLIFEQRKYTESYLYGLSLEPDKFNLYLITDAYLGLAQLMLDSNKYD
jgi:hypothetical protein